MSDERSEEGIESTDCWGSRCVNADGKHGGYRTPDRICVLVAQLFPSLYVIAARPHALAPIG